MPGMILPAIRRRRVLAGVVLAGVEAVAKSYPGFPAVLAAVAGGATGAHGERDRSPPAP